MCSVFRHAATHRRIQPRLLRTIRLGAVQAAQGVDAMAGMAAGLVQADPLQEIDRSLPVSVQAREGSFVKTGESCAACSSKCEESCKD